VRPTVSVTMFKFKSLKRSTDTVETEEDRESGEERPAKWSLGVLNDKRTIEVPGKSLVSLSTLLQYKQTRTPSEL
jgi:hypothetical protein